MATKIASLFAEIGADTTKLEAGLKTTKTGLSGAKDAFEQLTGSSLSAVGAFTAVAGALKFSVDAAMEAEKADANLAATLASTKGAAGLTADEIKRLSSALSDMSGQDDEAIQNANSMLLTFTSIGKEVFPMAAEAVVNMAAKFGSLDAASIQVGKALNDPISGVTALRKVGVMLTDQQEASIKSFMAVNDIASAQKVILDELGTEFGGLAAAMGQTLDGKIKRLQTSFGNLAEEVGGKLIPVLSDALDALNLLMTANVKIENAIQQHSTEVAKTTKTYEEYAKEMIRTHSVAIGGASTTEVVAERYRRLQGDLSGTIKSYGGLTRAEWEAAQGAGELTERITSQRPTLIGLTADMGDLFIALQNEEGAYYDTGSAAKTLTDAQVALNASGLALINESMKPLTTELIYQKAAVGLDAGAALELARSMGLVNEETYTALTALANLRTQFDSNRDGMIDAEEAARGFTDAVQTLANGNYLVTIRADFSDLERALSMASRLNQMGTSNIQGPTFSWTTPTPSTTTPTPSTPTPGPTPPVNGWGSGGAGGAQDAMPTTIINVNGYQGDGVAIAAEIARRQRVQEMLA